MIAVAFELSSPRASVALFRDGACVAEEGWTEGRPDNRRLFEVFEGLLRRAGLAASDPGLLIAGRGPGNYSGMRIALTVAQALALPGGARVLAAGSGAALAEELLAAGRARVAIAGDARRGQCWYGLFERPGGRLAQTVDWTLCPAGELPARIPAGVAVASPEYAKVRALAGAGAAAMEWIGHDAFPTARSLGALALAREARGEPGEPPSPIYLHPPVGPLPGAGTTEARTP